MYHGNLFATLAGIGKKTAWNIRANLSDKTIREDKRLTRAIIRLGGYLSFLPAAILYNSYESLESHGKYGYSRSRAEVIPNGFDTEVFRPNPAAKARLRSEWGIPKGCAVVGLVGRYHPIKDHPNFLEAARVLSAQGARARYVLAGTRIDHENHELAALLKEKGLEKHVVLLGERSDMHEVTAAFDIAVSSSRSEAFANVVGEAMACGVPCIVTDVGDSRRIIGETGLAVPPSDPDSLAGALKHMISQGKEREEAGKKARARVCREFSLAAVASKYESLYARMLAF
jgi:glycosyltransferase involved in cell wall biosynthesis